MGTIATKIVQAVQTHGKYVTQTRQEYNVALTLGSEVCLDLHSDIWPYAPLHKRYHFYAICTKNA
jgi:hypothetical protein